MSGVAPVCARDHSSAAEYTADTRHTTTAPSRSIKTTRELLPIKLAIKVPFQNICNAVAAVLQNAVEADHDMLSIEAGTSKFYDGQHKMWCLECIVCSVEGGGTPVVWRK